MVAMASSAALRSYVLALLVVMAVVPHISAQQVQNWVDDYRKLFGNQ